MTGVAPEVSLIQYKARQTRAQVRIEWFDKQLRSDMNIDFEKRLTITAQLLRDKIVANVSLPVERSGSTVVKRSVTGEFPRAETTRLMRDIFWSKTAKLRRIVGTSLDYGLYLEILLDRSFLRRSLSETQVLISNILARRMN